MRNMSYGTTPCAAPDPMPGRKRKLATSEIQEMEALVLALWLDFLDGEDEGPWNYAEKESREKAHIDEES